MANINSGSNTGKGPQGDQVKATQSDTRKQVSDTIGTKGVQSSVKDSVGNILKK